ncbi:hypothetical protein QUF50_10200 [Thiotrichales bacterium HSG1]|nr:hypothetical protein [Thiotrichales bacterium HSG1]
MSKEKKSLFKVYGTFYKNPMLGFNESMKTKSLIPNLQLSNPMLGFNESMKTKSLIPNLQLSNPMLAFNESMKKKSITGLTDWKLAVPNFLPIEKSISDISKRAFVSLNNTESFNLVSRLNLPLSELTAIGIDPYDYSYEYNDDEESINNESIVIRLDENRHIEVYSRGNNGSWTCTDENLLLPSDIYVTYHSNWKNVLNELEDIL